ncbi:MAG: 5'/3'-nucleotidase SurE [Tannerella sp.]|jgi:5'-nucleotidase|nr:5'/3'-nucleotidase SurE [Tannerella sp.]
MKHKPLIMITNDDGVTAEGIQAITESLRDLGDLIVFAPDGPRSGMSCAITAIQPISYTLIYTTPGLTVYSCTGTPVDCVKLALNEVVERKPDVLVSGINHGGNQALCVHYSGTMGATLEGCVFDIPSVGLSLADYTPDADFSEACRLGKILIKRVLANGLPYGTYLNLNVPNIPKVKGIAVCRQADGHWIKEFDKEEDANGEMLYWLTGEYLNRKPARADDDIQMLDKGYASLVPCLVDVTDHAFMNTLKTWDLNE